MPQEHRVEFVSPRTFFSERTVVPIDAWDLKLAASMVVDITERYDVQPYAFRFFTVFAHPPISDGEGGMLQVQEKRVKTAEGWHYLNGKIFRYEQVLERKEEFGETDWNMRTNGHPIAVHTTNSSKHITTFDEGDCVVDDKGNILVRGDDPELVAYREAKIAEWKKECSS